MAMNLPPELSALVLLSRQQMLAGRVKQVEGLIFEGVDWDYFIDRMKFHRLSIPVYHNLKAHYSEQVPPDVYKRIKGINYQNIMRGLKNSGEVVKLAAAFEKNSIPVLFFKGVCLSSILYDDPVARHSGDIDMLIAKSELNTAEDALASQGYSRLEPSPEMDASRFDIYSQIRFHAKYKSANNTIVELHWRFCNIKEMFSTSFDELWQQRQYVAINDFKIPTLNHHYTLLFLFIHGSKHGWERLFWLKDIADFYVTYKTFDWAALEEEAKKNRITHFAGEAFLLVSQLYGMKMPDRFHRLLRNRYHVAISAKIINYLYVTEVSPLTTLLFFWRKFFVYNRYHKFSYLISIARSSYYRKCLAGDGDL